MPLTVSWDKFNDFIKDTRLKYYIIVSKILLNPVDTLNEFKINRRRHRDQKAFKWKFMNFVGNILSFLIVHNVAIWL